MATELYLEEYLREGRLKSFVTLYLANINGVQQTRGSGGRGFLDPCNLSAIKGESLNIYHDGNYLRDYLYIDDAIELFYFGGKTASNHPIKFFSVGTGTGTTLKSAL